MNEHSPRPDATVGTAPLSHLTKAPSRKRGQDKCRIVSVAIEIDGGYHQDKEMQKQDQYRQELVEAYGIRFFRCTADDVENDLTSVLEKITNAANQG